MNEEPKQNIFRKAYWWLYKKPKWKKSGLGLVAELSFGGALGAIGGYGISWFLITSNPLYLIVAIPVAFHLTVVGRNIYRGNVDYKKRQEEFKKTHDGMDMLTYVDTKLAETRTLQRMVQDNMDELVRRGLVKEEFDKDGKQAWYIPEEKLKDVEAFLKELDEKIGAEQRGDENVAI